MNIEHVVYRTDPTGEEVEVLLDVEGSYQAEERPTWGYYGGSPGCPEDVEVCEISEKLPLEGPVRFEHQRQPIGYAYVPWTGDLTKDEEEAVREALLQQAHDDIEAAEEARAEAAYEARYDRDFDS